MVYAPVVLLGYARPNETRQIIDRINQSKTKKVYFFVDFPNDIDDAKLMKLNADVKALNSTFNKEIDVESVFFENNIGPFEAYNQCMSIVFSKEEELIFLEDDKLPSVSFFSFCSELLAKYKNDERILFISGMNSNKVILEDYNYDYFFANVNSSWGHGIWKRTYDKFDSIFHVIKDEYYKKLIQQYYILNKNRHNVLEEIRSYLVHGKYNGHVASMEFYMMGALGLLTNSIVIVPSKNLISDTGATEYTVHGDEYKLMTRSQKKIFFKETYELTSPLKHPPFVISDFRFNRTPYIPFRGILWFLEKTERAFLILKYKGVKFLFKRLKRLIKIKRNSDYLNKP